MKYLHRVNRSLNDLQILFPALYIGKILSHMNRDFYCKKILPGL